jgi:hypothetical protein
MSQRKPNKKTAARSIEEVVLVTPAKTAPPGTIEAHSKTFGTSITTPLLQLKEDWNVINQQVAILLDQTATTTSKSGYGLDEVSFALGINGKGHIGFLAGIEAGGEASITLKFKKK